MVSFASKDLSTTRTRAVVQEEQQTYPSSSSSSPWDCWCTPSWWCKSWQWKEYRGWTSERGVKIPTLTNRTCLLAPLVLCHSNIVQVHTLAFCFAMSSSFPAPLPVPSDLFTTLFCIRRLCKWYLMACEGHRTVWLGDTKNYHQNSISGINHQKRNF